MNNEEKQDKTLIIALYDRGYTVAAAARRLGCTRGHLWHVLMGNRTSDKLKADALSLPPRPLQMREKAACC